MSALSNPTGGPQARRRREGGAALLVAVMMLALMGLIGFASMDTVMRSRQMAGNTSLSQSALYAADAGVAQGIEVLRSEILPDSVGSGFCLTNTVPNITLPNGASYEADPDSTQICWVADLANAEGCVGESSAEVGSGVDLKYTLWSIQTEGQAPGGATARVQAVVARCHQAS